LVGLLNEEPRNLNYRALGIAFAICFGVATWEASLGADGLHTWYAGLAMPGCHLPIWGFVAVAIVVYLVNGFIAYRLCAVPLTVGGRAIGLTALVVVMLFNALWNYALFESQDLFIGVFGLVAFIAPLSILQVTLLVYDRRSAVVLGAYFAWVLLYDIPLHYSMWLLNSP